MAGWFIYLPCHLASKLGLRIYNRILSPASRLLPFRFPGLKHPPSRQPPPPERQAPPVIQFSAQMSLPQRGLLSPVILSPSPAGFFFLALHCSLKLSLLVYLLSVPPRPSGLQEGREGLRQGVQAVNTVSGTQQVPNIFPLPVGLAGGGTTQRRLGTCPRSHSPEFWVSDRQLPFRGPRATPSSCPRHGGPGKEPGCPPPLPLQQPLRGNPPLPKLPGPVRYPTGGFRLSRGHGARAPPLPGLGSRRPRREEKNGGQSGRRLRGRARRGRGRRGSRVKGGRRAGFQAWQAPSNRAQGAWVAGESSRGKEGGEQ